MSYVVANPSSYAWPSATRPLPADDAAPDNAKGAWETDKPHTKFSYGAFEGDRRVPELRPLAGGLPEQNRGLHREHQR